MAEPAPLDQDVRLMTVTTPLGADLLVLSGYTGQEHISGLFSFHLDLIAKVSDAPKVKFESLLGQPFVVESDIYTATHKQHRYFHGICVRFMEGGEDLSFAHYRAEIVPTLWLLTRRARSRIYQQISVPDILKKVLAEYGTLKYELKLQGVYEKREYCVQYGETDFNFVSRLMEEEGIYYFFKHTQAAHTMVITDSALNFPDVTGEKAVEFDTVGGSNRDAMNVHSWQKQQELRSGKYTLWDSAFQLPNNNLQAQKTVLSNLQVGEVPHQLKVAGNDLYELYEYPGQYAKRFDGIDRSGGEQAGELSKVMQDNNRTVQLRIEAENARAVQLTGSSNCQHFTAGHKFTLTKHPNANGAYVLASVSHSASGGTSYRSGGGDYRYDNSFECFPATLAFRPPRLTPHPMVNGVQTAIVVGPAGEDIFTDKYGRVKVQFHWDRDGQNDANSSCWLRVGSTWAGKQWGMVQIPRIGQEVLVDFINGDPDAPIIVGSVYNPSCMPPYKLPDHKTQSGLKSRSTLQGGPDNFNEIRFEDKKGQEQVFINAEKDLDVRVENDARHFVGKDEHIIVAGNQKEKINGNAHSHVVGNRVGKIDGNEHLQVTGSRATKITMSEAVDATMSMHLKAGINVVIEATTMITLKVPGSFITISSAGVSISGPMVMLNSGGAPGAGAGANPTSPEPPDTADDGTKATKLA